MKQETLKCTHRVSVPFARSIHLIQPGLTRVFEYDLSVIFCVQGRITIASAT
jgi:hypothetical protein